ncbi:Nuclear import receptor [Naganishia albida]|nr:Nuclear import receptor [Naganishia albida]
MTSTPTTNVDQATQTALLAIHALFHDPDAQAKKRANEWLSEFQHTSEAWQTCHTLLTAQDAPQEAKMVAAQTLRSKVVYDISQLPRESLLPLRDSLLQSLTQYTNPSAPTGSRAVTTQLCLALADLAYQLPEWKDVIAGMVDTFGQRVESVEMLLEFLKVLVEEAGNPRIPLNSAEAADRSSELLSSQREKVLGLLEMYLSAQGVTSRVQTAVFETLRAWLQAGEIDANMIAQTRLFQFTFEALANIELFDAAVDVICDMIHETQEVEDNVQVVEMIVPKVIALRPVFDQAVKDEDDDAVRGYCRIFTEAGETYRQLILAHPDTFLPLVEAIGQCAAYHDLDIVPITFAFWWKFGQALGKRARQDDRYDEEDAGPSSTQHQAIYGPFLQVYANLQDSMIRHLQFPQGDNAGFTNAAARDEFRAFRHDMGDTLKDCCAVLGANVCMKRSYDLVMTALAKGDAMVWQEVEAPLFSMRSMGAEVDPSDDEVLPHIMDMLPTLPRHPKIQYAAILVISRYTQWINQHPSYLSFQLNYISSGFEIQTDDVAAAAAQAMKWMCKDCKEHLVPYLGQLYSFITTAGAGLEIDDRIEVTEAIGYVISIMPPNDAAEALQRFTQPVLQQIQTLGAGPILHGREETTPLTEALEQLEAYVATVSSIDPLPASCQNTAGAIYQVLDQLIDKYYASYSVADRVCNVLRRGLSFFPFSSIRPILPAMLERLNQSFERSGHPQYIWIIGKCVGLFGKQVEELGPAAGDINATFANSLERVTLQVRQMEVSQGAREIPDVMEDFCQFILQYVLRSPSTLRATAQLPNIIELALAATLLPAGHIVMTALELIEDLLQGALRNGDASPSGTTPADQPVLQAVAQQFGQRILTMTLQGIAQDYPEDSQEPVTAIVKSLCTLAPPETLRQWIAFAIDGVPGHVIPISSKQEMLQTFDRVFAEGNPELVKNAIRLYVRTARRARDRRDRMSNTLSERH